MPRANSGGRRGGRSSSSGSGPGRRRPSTGGKGPRRDGGGERRESGAPRGDRKFGGSKFSKGNSRSGGFKSKGTSQRSGEEKSERPFSRERRSDSSFRPKSNFGNREGRGHGDQRSERPFSRGRGKDSSSFRSKSKFDDQDKRRSGDGEGQKSERPFSRGRGKDSSSFRPKSKFGNRTERRSDEGSRAPRSERPFSKGGRKASGFGSKSKFDDRNERRADAPREERRPRKTSGEKRGFFSKTKSVDKTEEAAAAVAPVQTEKMRLNRYIANSGVCSRREADELITMGLISVNGQTITELGYKVNPGDEVRYENRVLRAEKPVYVLLNKPKGYLTTTDDPQERKTVMHLLGNNIKERIYPVGRLDRNTTGLLLLTNDGELADKLMHPSYNVKKIYKVELDRPLNGTDFQAILDGVRLEEGKAMVDDLAIVSDDGKTVGIELHIGWNRVVRRIFESLNYQVLKLDRSVYAGLDKKDLGRGEWRFLSREEIVRLKHFK